MLLLGLMGCLCLYLALQLLRKTSRSDQSWISDSFLFRYLVTATWFQKTIGERSMDEVRTQNPGLFCRGGGEV